MATKVDQDIPDDGTHTRDTDQYQKEYMQRFVEKWDDLIDWDARAGSEGAFFVEELRKRGAKKILDVATGTGFHSVRLLEAGFEVWSADGSHEMLGQAFSNAYERGHILRTIKADWRWLNKDITDETFDAIICLGNSFTHLHTEHDRRKALSEFYALLRHDGVLILDQRNYDQMLDEGYKSKHAYYYVGQDVEVEPEYVDPGLARFRYDFADGETYYLNFFPLRKNYTRRLMREVGFQDIHTFGDFKADYAQDDPDFFVHVAEKRYRPPEEVNSVNDNPKGEADRVVEVSREYYNSSPADRFYANIWGGEDIHIGMYESDDESIFDASRRTVETMLSLVPGLDETKKVIDLGAGYGGAARLMVEKYGCHVACLNLSEVQNERNRALNRDQGYADKIEVVDGNFEDVPYPDESFDVVWSQESYLHSGDRDRAIAESVRILKPGGTFIFSDPMQTADADPDALQPVLERIHLDTLGSVPFYRDVTKRYGLEERQIMMLSEHLPSHYGRVLREIERREDEMVGLCGQDYIDHMKKGLRHWVENGRAGNLEWGILVFQKPE